MNSPYTKHLDAALDAPGTAMTVPSYAAAPMAAPMAPMVVHAPSSDSGSKVGIVLVALVVAIIAGVAGAAIGSQSGPTWNELKRFEALAGREGEIRGRDSGWLEGRKQGRTEMSFLAKYAELKTQATAFNQGWQQGLSTGNAMGVARSRYRYGYPYGRYGYGRGYGYRRGYGYGYGYGSVGRAVGNAQAIANATGQPVDVVVN